MGRYKDKELDRILSESDALLADLNFNLYETPEEEAERLKKEAEERQRAEEARRLEEARKAAEEEERRKLEEARKAAEEEERRKLEEARKAAEEEESHKLEDIRSGAREEESNELEDARRTTEEEESHELEDTRSGAREVASTAEAEEQTKLNTQKSYLNVATVFFMIVSFMFMEVVTHIGCYKSVGSNIIYPLFYAGALGALGCVISSIFGKKVNTLIALLLQLLFGAFCDLQLICYGAMGTFLRVMHPRDDMWLLLHSEQIKEGISATLPWLVLMFLPIVFWAVIGRKFICFEKSLILTKVVLILGMIIFAVLGVVLLDVKGYENYSPYTAFYKYESGSTTEQAGNQLGMTALIVLELFNH